ncbi:hypothetical protein [Psychroserpens sp.]|uniref:hypothetical protein n=1 Tax=Psychroserpens sp. TaxID=2020870 RepID=UPI003C78414C
MKNLIFFLIFIVGNITIGQQRIAIGPVSENTILLYFDEGEKDFSDYTGFYFYDVRFNASEILNTEDVFNSSKNSIVFPNPNDGIFQLKKI